MEFWSVTLGVYCSASHYHPEQTKFSHTTFEQRR